MYLHIPSHSVHIHAEGMQPPFTGNLLYLSRNQESMSPYSKHQVAHGKFDKMYHEPCPHVYCADFLIKSQSSSLKTADLDGRSACILMGLELVYINMTKHVSRKMRIIPEMLRKDNH